MSEKKGAERRRHPRTRKRYSVRFGPGDLAHTGYTQDVSETGIYIQASVIYPPNTLLVIQIDYPEKTASIRGLVRWSKELPPAFRRSLKGGMGVEFTTPSSSGSGKVVRPAQTPPGPIPPGAPSTPPPQVTEKELGGGATRRRQVSTMAGNTFQILQTEYRGAFYVRAFQLPLTEGSGEALLNKACWTREEAEAAIKEFLKEH